MRTYIDSNETKRILEMHSKLRNKSLLEQAVNNQANPNVTSSSTNQSSVIKSYDNELKILNDARTSGCLKNGDITYDKNTKEPVYVVKTKSGNDAIFYANMTYKISQTSKTGTWYCPSSIKYKQDSGNSFKNANDILKGLRDSGWYTEEEVDVRYRVNPTPISKIYPQWNKYFSEDINLYKKEQGITLSPTTGTYASLDKFREDLDKLTISGCKNIIDVFFNGFYYNQRSVVSTEELIAKKTEVEYCSKKFDFNNILYAKTRNKLLILGGISKNNIPGASRESPYRIDLPGKYLNN